MEKANVMKALELCGTGSETCTGCPYYGMDGCDRHMCDDALTLLKANEQSKAIQYHAAYRFTKRDNLLKWLYSKPYQVGHPAANDNNIAYYEKEREIQLILLVRHDEDKCICRIKCPINPLPTKGEFVVTNAGDVARTLVSLGWTFKDKLNLWMFK